jgi:hypothetical protein
MAITSQTLFALVGYPSLIHKYLVIEQHKTRRISMVLKIHAKDSKN